jgi:ATP-dependent 26S proteasome regulatory subunit
MNRSLSRVFRVLSGVNDHPRSEADKLKLLKNVIEDDSRAFYSFLLEYLSTERAARESAKEGIQELEGYLKELTAPPYKIASFIQFECSSRDKALVKMGDQILAVQLDRNLDKDHLMMGDDVFLGNEGNLIVQRATDVPYFGRPMIVQEVRPASKIIASPDNGENIIAFKAERCDEVSEGDTVVVSQNGIVLERLCKADIDGVNTLGPEIADKPITFVGYEELSTEMWTFKNIFKYPQLAAEYGLEKGNHLLLAGPPGTGKTLFARNLAFELGAELFVVNGSSLFDKYVGNTEKNIRDLFKRVAEHVPALLLLDEADALAQKRGQNMQGYRDGFLNVLLGELNGALESPQFSVLVTTNRLDMLDPAFVKRLKTINFPMPRRAALKEIVRVHLGTVPLTDALSIDELTSRVVNLLSCPNAENSLVRVGYRDGKSRVIEAHELVAGREVKMLVKEAGKRALNRTVSGESVPVTLRDFELAVEIQFNIWRSSLNRNNIRDYVYDLPDDAQIASVEPIKQVVSVTYLYPEAADVRQ